MSIERVNIQTTSFSLRATNIRGGQLQNLLNALRRQPDVANPNTAAPRLPVGSVGPGAIESPAQRFPQVASPSGSGSPSATNGSNPVSSAPDASNGFAPGGDNSMRSLDQSGMMRMIMELLERLLQAVFQMLGQGGAQGSSLDGTKPTGGCGGGPSAGAACGGNGSEGTSQPAPSGGGSAPVPPHAGSSGSPTESNGSGHGCGTGSSGNSRARPKHSSGVRRLLRGIGRGAAAAAPLVPGGAAAREGVRLVSRLGGDNAGSTNGAPSGIATGTLNNRPDTLGRPSLSASFEERLFQFLGSKVRDSERELDTAMQQGAGGAGGDSRTLATQQVQQLVQKRSELVETLTNTLKTLHESTSAVTSNIK